MIVIVVIVFATCLSIYKAFRSRGKPEPSWFWQVIFSDLLLASILGGLFFGVTAFYEEKQAIRLESRENLNLVREAVADKPSCNVDSENLTIKSFAYMKLIDQPLTGQNLNNIDFSYSDFSKAKLYGSCFRNSSFVETDFSEANLGQVDFTGASLQGADFRTAINIESACFKDVKLGVPDNLPEKRSKELEVKWPNGFVHTGSDDACTQLFEQVPNYSFE